MVEISTKNASDRNWSPPREVAYDARVRGVVAGEGSGVRKFDQQIVESVNLRRGRLRNAFFFGPERWRRQAQDHVKPLVFGVIAAAVLCAGCVATSFVANLLDKQAQQERQRNAPVVTNSHAPSPASSTTSRAGTTSTSGNTR